MNACHLISNQINLHLFFLFLPPAQPSPACLGTSQGAPLFTKNSEAVRNPAHMTHTQLEGKLSQAIPAPFPGTEPQLGPDLNVSASWKVYQCGSLLLQPMCVMFAKENVLITRHLCFRRESHQIPAGCDYKTAHVFQKSRLGNKETLMMNGFRSLTTMAPHPEVFLLLVPPRSTPWSHLAQPS